MAAIDSLLGILIDNGGDELRLATDEAPRMAAKGTPRRLALPVTTEEMLGHLLAGVLGAEHDEKLARSGSARSEYVFAARGERFNVTARSRGGSEGGGPPRIEVVFFRVAGPAGSAAIPAVKVPDLDRLRARDVIARASAPEPEPKAPTIPAAARVGQELLVAIEAEPEQDAPGDSAELSALVEAARALRASDLHLRDGEAPTLRIDGALRPMPGVPASRVAGLFQAMPAQALADAARGGAAMEGALDAGGARVRYTVYRSDGGLSAALRLLPGRAPRLAELSLPLPLEDLAALPHGLVLVCGPTGSGKSATLAALAREVLETRTAALLSLEDPIEYLLPPGRGLVRQRQVGRDVPDFASGLREALRSDPDVMLVGELRDAETIALALTAAETGHLVLASLHSRTAAGTIERIVDGAGGRRESETRAQLAQSLRAVVSQRLVPRARGSGRVAAVEVLRVTHAVSAMIREGRTAQIASAMQAGRKEGSSTLEACLAEQVRAGTITREDAATAAGDRGALDGYL